MKGWARSTLGEQVTLQRGFDITKEAMSTGPYPVISSGGINGFHSKAMALGPGVILGRKGSVGKIHYVESPYWPHDTTLWVKDFHGNWPRFVYHFFAQFPISRYEASTANPSLNRNNLHPVPVHWPPFAEQKRIAEILDRADALRAKRRAALGQLDTLTQSIFLDLFGDPLKNEKNWPTGTLGSHASKIGSGSTPTGGDASYKSEGISLIRSLNVRDGEFTFRELAFIDDTQASKLANVVVSRDDVLLNITGASVARVCRAPASVLPARVNQHVMIIRPAKDLTSEFLEQCLLNSNTKRKLLGIAESGATRQAITKAQVEALEIPLPPSPSSTNSPAERPRWKSSKRCTAAPWPTWTPFSPPSNTAPSEESYSPFVRSSRREEALTITFGHKIPHRLVRAFRPKKARASSPRLLRITNSPAEPHVAADVRRL